MKIISQILSLFLSDMKPWQIYMVLVFITLTFEVGLLMFVTSWKHAVQTFAKQDIWLRSQTTGDLSLCH